MEQKLSISEAHRQLDEVFGREFIGLRAYHAVLVCKDVIELAKAEGVSVGKASNILYERVWAGNLDSYARCLEAGERRREREGGAR